VQIQIVSLLNCVTSYEIEISCHLTRILINALDAIPNTFEGEEWETEYDHKYDVHCI
jgi:hypothetical protein